jgi:hypothetical protein
MSSPLLLNERLATIPGYADSVILSTVVGTDGVATTKISLTLSTGAVSGRYLGNDQPGFGVDDVDDVDETASADETEAATDDESATTDDESATTDEGN